MPGDRYFRKALEGKQMRQWYFPSKYNMQDFRVDEYFEMQGERLAPREVHRSIPAVQQMLQDVSKRRAELRSFFEKLDEQTFRQNPSLQDLYGLYRMVDDETALRFEPPAHAFVEHSPEKLPPEQMLVALKWKLGLSAFTDLEARIGRMQSMDEVESFLWEECKTHNIVPDILGFSVHVDWDAEARFAGQPAGRDAEDADASPLQDSAQKVGAKLALVFGSNPTVPVAKTGEEAETDSSINVSDPSVKAYLARRHRFIDPMFRRRRLKWLERQMAGKNNPTEVKFNSYYATHPDNHKVWPTNKGSVTVTWPSPYH